MITCKIRLALAIFFINIFCSKHFVTDRMFEMGLNASVGYAYFSPRNEFFSSCACATTSRAPLVYSGYSANPHTIVGNFVAGIFDGMGDEAEKVSTVACWAVQDYLKKFYTVYPEKRILHHNCMMLSHAINNFFATYPAAQESGTNACVCILEGPLCDNGSINDTFVEGDAPYTVYRAAFINVGSSRALIIRNNQIVFMTQGNNQSLWGNVNGAISSSDRLVSDIYLFGIPTQASNELLKIKQDVTYLLPNDTIVIANKAFWDTITCEQVCSSVTTMAAQSHDMNFIAQELINKASIQNTLDNNRDFCLLLIRFMN